MRIRNIALTGLAAAAVAYYLDPVKGRARRSRLRGQLMALTGKAMRRDDRTPLPENVAPASMPAPPIVDKAPQVRPSAADALPEDEGDAAIARKIPDAAPGALRSRDRRPRDRCGARRRVPPRRVARRPEVRRGRRPDRLGARYPEGAEPPPLAGEPVDRSPRIQGDQPAGHPEPRRRLERVGLEHPLDPGEGPSNLALRSRPCHAPVQRTGPDGSVLLRRRVFGPVTVRAN